MPYRKRTGDALSYTAATVQNAWVADTGYRAPGYVLDSHGFVHLCGAVKSGATGTTAFTLPAGLRPATYPCFVPVLVAGGAMGWLTIDTTGVVVPHQATETYLDGVTFLAGA